jgi:uncharacterized protein (TIGR03437 family)
MELRIAENGVTSSAFTVIPVGDNIHILTECDLAAFASADFAPAHEFGLSSATYATCRPIARHLDGSAITMANPATPAEVVLLYAWGVGPTQPLGVTGDLPPFLKATALNPSSFSSNTSPSPSSRVSVRTKSMGSMKRAWTFAGGIDCPAQFTVADLDAV